MSTSFFSVVRRVARLFVPLLGVAALLPALAAAPAGTVIGNQAAATYSDGSAVVRTVTSNTVVTTVQQVAAVSVVASGTKTISIGGQVYYPHTLTNSGNGTDSFALSATNGGGFTFAATLFYADANGDGVPDNNVPITSTGQLAAGQAFRFVVAGIVPGTAVAGASNTMTTTATSGFTPGTTGSVVDQTTITAQAVINATQALDVTSGPSPSVGSRTLTLTFTNTGNTTATNLTLTELIPAGMTYVAGSARWSGSGATVLTDADAADGQGGIVYDHNVTAANRVTAVIASVPPGGSGTLSFQVTVNAGLPAGAHAATAATASFSYHDGATTVPASNTNTVQYVVLGAAVVSMTGATVTSAPQGGVVNFTNTITNNGNATDTFDLSTLTSTFPAGTTFQFFQADGVTPIVDHNGNGIPDTGPVPAGGAVNIVVRAILPPDAAGGPYGVVAKATSSADPTKSASAPNTLTAITASTVDLTNNGSGAGAPGYGPGPEAVAVSTATVASGGTARITLVVANGGSVADSFALRASTDATFATTTLPSGWTVVFRDASGAVLDNTGVINSGANKAIYADVTVPAGASAGATQLYFRAQSATTGAGDTLHNAVAVGTVRSLALTPNNTAQLTPGGTTVYTHMLTNTGNVSEADGVLSTGSLGVTDSAPGFTSVIYWDKNNDGVLDAGDPVITDLSQLVGGTNGANTTPGLAPGKSARLFVKTSAPAGATSGATNITTLSAALAGVNGGAAAPMAATATDTSTVIVSQVTLFKTQALDAGCDGTADTAFSPVAITSGAAPGGCIRYEITATNVGPVAVTSLVVSDATPAYTTYSATVPASATAGTVTAPAGGGRGTLQTSVATLAPGASVVLRFGVRIDP
ncbi:beta strand repeat-containing protein [Roseateles sp. DC23W]|uniref:Beta strand repeat-containing protein n=1 Tax=Pelomonas dachongensis TaxID=3299029 RepID=A0ABW7EN73_9BURK